LRDSGLTILKFRLIYLCFWYGKDLG